MSFFSLHYLVFVALLALAMPKCATNSQRRLLLSAGNLLFVFTFVQTSLAWMSLGAFLGLSYAMLWAVRAGQGRFLAPAFIGLSVLVLAVVKRYDFLAIAMPREWLAHPVEIIGISYMTFKLIHMIVDLRQGQLAPFNLATYANYQLGFFSLVAGPIQRYNDFHGFWQGREAALAEPGQRLRAWSRVLTGLVKVGLVAVVALSVYERGRSGMTSSSPVLAAASVLATLYAYPAYVYLNFAGYCDAVIGAAALLGMKQQENFDRPYLARNVNDFWNRWHISLTLWIRDYVFTTSYKWVAERWPGQAVRAGYGLLFLALLLAGIWHGPTWNFAAFGAIHGVGIAATQIYGDALKSRLGRAGVKKYLENRWFHAAAVLVTIHYVCFSFLFFAPRTRETLQLMLTALTKLV